MSLDPSIFGDDALKKNLCSVEGCSKPRHHRFSMCAAHQKRHERGQSLEKPLRPRFTNSERPACGNPLCARPVYAKGLCWAHWKRGRRGSETRTVIAARNPVGTMAHLAGFAVRKETKAALRARAKSCGLSLSAMARRVLDEWAKQFHEDFRSSDSRISEVSP